MIEIDERTSDQIDLLAQEGNVLLDDDNDPEAAIQKWTQALGLLPAPSEKNSEALWLYASIGEAWLQLGNEREAQFAFGSAYRSPEGHINPLVLLRLGELGMEDKDPLPASQYLLRAYMMEGKQVFEGSPQAFEFLKKHQTI